MMRKLLARPDENELRELWRQKLVSYHGHKKGKGLGETLLVLGIFLFNLGSASGFDKSVLGFSGLFYGAYILFFVIFNRKINRIKSPAIPKEKAVALKVLSLAVQDLVFVAMILVTSIAIGSLILAGMVKWDFFVRKITGFWFSVFILGVLLSPFRLKYKVGKKQLENFKYLPHLLAMSASLPGALLLFFEIVPQIQDVSAKLLVSMILFLTVSIIMLPFWVWGIYEIVFLATRPWPKIQKVKTEFLISFQDM